MLQQQPPEMHRVPLDQLVLQVGSCPSRPRAAATDPAHASGYEHGVERAGFWVRVRDGNARAQGVERRARVACNDDENRPWFIVRHFRVGEARARSRCG